MHLRTHRTAEHFEKDSLNTLKHNSLPFSLLQEFTVFTVALFLNLQLVINQSQILYSTAGTQDTGGAYVYIHRDSKGPFRYSSTIRNSSQRVGSYPSRGLISFIVLWTTEQLILTEIMSYTCSLTSDSVLQWISGISPVNLEEYQPTCTCHICFGCFPARKRRNSSKPA